ncbi:MAG: peptidoglycan-binding protein [Polyangiaceae bacterium]
MPRYPLQMYIVRQGDYLTRLAVLHGFDPDEVWNLDENRELRERRPNPNQLAPGDVLQIPAQRAEGPSFASGGTQRYKADVPKVHIKIHIQSSDAERQPEPWQLFGAGKDPITGTLGRDGNVEFDVPVTVTECLLRLPQRRVSYPIHVGHLDPIEEDSGVLQRLAHLGYLAPSLRDVLSRGVLGATAHRPTVPEPPDDAREHALRSFQRAAGLTETGVVDEATRDALRSAHDGDEDDSDRGPQ